VDEHRKAADLKTVARGAFAVEALERLETDLLGLLDEIGTIEVIVPDPAHDSAAEDDEASASGDTTQGRKARRSGGTSTGGGVKSKKPKGDTGPS
jgi:hypothetical protein